MSTKTLHRILEAAGIDRIDAQGRRVDLHGLRHTAASRMARHGIPLAITQKVLGHATVQMTARIYTHLGVDDLRAALEAAGHAARRRQRWELSATR